MGEMSGPISDTVYKGLFTFQDAFVYIRSYLLATACLFINILLTNLKDQLLLLQESWKDLFLLHLSQWAVPWDLSNLLNNRQNSLRTNGHILSIEEEVVDMEIKTMQVSILR